MNIRARRTFRASGHSTTIAVVFSIVSVASTLAGGHSNIASRDNMQPEISSPSWQEGNEESKNEQQLCSVNPGPTTLGT